MNARTDPAFDDLQITLTSTRFHSIVVSPWGFPLEADYEHDPGEDPVVSGGPDNWHPGTPPNVEVIACRIGGVDVTDMLGHQQRERIEDEILRALE